MRSLPEDPTEQGQNGEARLRVEARMGRCMWWVWDQGSQSLGKGPVAHEASVCHDRPHLRLVDSLRQNYSLQNQIIENA